MSESHQFWLIGFQLKNQKNLIKKRTIWTPYKAQEKISPEQRIVKRLVQNQGIKLYAERIYENWGNVFLKRKECIGWKGLHAVLRKYGQSSLMQKSHFRLHTYDLLKANKEIIKVNKNNQCMNNEKEKDKRHY